MPSSMRFTTHGERQGAGEAKIGHGRDPECEGDRHPGGDADGNDDYEKHDQAAEAHW